MASIMPAKLAETLGLTETVRSIPIVEPTATHAIGLVVPDRDPTTPLIKALIAEARQVATLLDKSNQSSGVKLRSSIRNRDRVIEKSD